MKNRMVNMEMSRDRFQTIIEASKKASQRGDYLQAERLLKSSLKQAERDKAIVQYAIEEIVENLASLYKLQGRPEEAQVLKTRTSQDVTKEETDNYNRLTIVKNDSSGAV